LKLETERKKRVMWGGGKVFLAKRGEVDHYSPPKKKKNPPWSPGGGGGEKALEGGAEELVLTRKRILKMGEIDIVIIGSNQGTERKR